jgi:hypothetical protein
MIHRYYVGSTCLLAVVFDTFRHSVGFVALVLVVVLGVLEWQTAVIIVFFNTQVRTSPMLLVVIHIVVLLFPSTAVSR